MAEVQAFRGWRYDLSQVGSFAGVTAPPYDVINQEQQNDLYKQHPCNVVRLILNREEPGDDGSDARYRRAAGFLKHWREEGILQQERESALYVYHQEFEWEGTKYVRRGFLGRLRIEEFGTGSVYPHELTMSGPKADRLALLNACRTNLSPIFGLYPDSDSAVQNPLETAITSITPCEATDELGVLHRVWAVTDRAAISQVVEQLANKPIFIADGHHRYETALNYRNQLRESGDITDETAAGNFVLMHFVGMNDPGLAILPTHRLLSGLPSLSADDLRSALEGSFEIEDVGTGDSAAQDAWEMIEADGGQNLLAFGTNDGRWQLARMTDSAAMKQLAPDQSETWQGLGVSILHRLVFEKLVTDRFPDADISCRYVHLLDEVTTAQKDNSCQLACLVAPAGIELVEEIASKLEKMPQKSTYFYPKLLSGLVFNSLE
ncbi:MAG: DUF1015 domain-containing protein [Planctomycetaceae bacterium]|jgi:uncharacterized protein (DUF1015 family)|nr:DUF1015 domain-containing protein [Planctomycetaceae bacterium]MBT6155472.1 DUF1015 domain-containing protein [Planctomycetaceae bacterium]MBT6483666.1 DUF1015 domain-containing protein [Planctomycetaceae bacterium]MBT6496291.1 DUF1015 domain-containing protein [Planctomycetaceae bacterium]